VQLELAQLNYMDEDSFAYDEAKASVLQASIEQLLRLCVA
jgi:N-formylglutamate deformylase